MLVSYHFHASEYLYTSIFEWVSSAPNKKRFVFLVQLHIVQTRVCGSTLFVCLWTPFWAELPCGYQTQRNMYNILRLECKQLVDGSLQLHRRKQNSTLRPGGERHRPHITPCHATNCTDDLNTNGRNSLTSYKLRRRHANSDRAMAANNNVCA